MKNTAIAGLLALESRINDLVATCARLKQENTSLLARQEALVGERAELVEKTELARTKVDAMITRLKGMETTA